MLVQLITARGIRLGRACERDVTGSRGHRRVADLYDLQAADFQLPVFLFLNLAVIKETSE